MVPQASVTLPHVLPSSWQRFGSPASGSHVPPTHCSPVGQLPQASVPPHPLLAAPQLRPRALQVVTAHVSHWYENASQTWGAMQVPHVSV